MINKVLERKIKILYIGNIANNAYQNAKILNANGPYECDVICNDYYHVMGCPEWDEADFDHECVNQFYPDWLKVNLHGFKRPRWFIQGPTDLCIAYLYHKESHHVVRAGFLWKWILLSNHFIAKNSAKGGFTALGRVSRFFSRFFSYVKVFFVLLLTNPTELVRKICRRITKTRVILLRDPKVELELDKYIALFNRLFPDRECILGDVTRRYIASKGKWEKLFTKYAIVQGYATSAIIPFVAGCKNYIAFEHGTIRDIKESRNEIDQLTMLAFANAKYIYSTNTDCYKDAEYICKNTETKIVCGLHGIDINNIFKRQNDKNDIDVREKYYNKSNGALFFAPARFTYDDNTKGFLKGQEKYLVAVNNLAKDQYNFKVLAVEWGNDLDRFKNLIKTEYPYAEEHFIWVSPLKKKEYYNVLNSVDAVIDQLYLHAFGAISIETLCSTNAVLISESVDEDLQIKYWSELVPAFFVDEIDDVYKAMKTVITEPERIRIMAREEQDWVKRNHSSDRIYSLSDKVYSEMIMAKKL